MNGFPVSGQRKGITSAGTALLIWISQENFIRSKSNRPRSKKSKDKYKSGLERRFAEMLLKHGVNAKYEPVTFPFVKMAHYKPDWEITNRLYVETKGYFSPSNRGNLLAFKEQYPEIEIFLVFAAPYNKLSSKSKTTYAQWCEQHGFRWSSIDNFPIQLFEKKETK